MPREVTDGDGVRWECVEAYAGLSEGGEAKELARAEGERGVVDVVCTPSGGAQTVRLQLDKGWESGHSDEELLREIEVGRGESAVGPPGGK